MTDAPTTDRTVFSAKQKLGLVLGPALFFLILFFTAPAGMSAAARAVLAATLWIATWWITETIPIAVTALLPIILFPLTGGLDIKTTTSAYGQPMIFLFIGGFMLAVAIEKWNLHKRIAINVIRAMGTDSSKIILGFMTATALLSMWISNTATTLMMVPIGLAIIHQLSEFVKDETGSADQNSIFGKALMLSICYSASIGGMATLIGTPTNVVFSGIVRQLYDVEVSFSQWMMFGLPASVVLLLVCWLYLVRVAFPLARQEMPGGRKEIDRQLVALGRMSVEEKWVAAVFSCTALAWISRSFVLSKIIPGTNDTVIAVAGAVVLFLIPARSRPGTKLLDWESAARLPWGIILLFGGGLALAAGFKESGLAEWIGSQLNLLEGVALLVILAFVVACVNFLTEITSNVATASMILPILSALALAIDVHPFGLMIAACVAASCAFMLPVATPPNAVVFGSGYLKMQDMVRTGIWMNLLSIAFLTLFVYFLLPLVWRLDLQAFPDALR
ncbi:MAG: SLC13 family permease [bacterium]